MLNHVTDTERVFVFRALWFARGFDSPLPSFDQNMSSSMAGADEIAWSRTVEEFDDVRRATVDFFRNLPADAWMKSGIASDNPLPSALSPSSPPATSRTTWRSCGRGTSRRPEPGGSGLAAQRFRRDVQF